MQSQHKDAVDTQLCVSDGKMLNLLYSEYLQKKKKKIGAWQSLTQRVNVDFRPWLN